MPVSRKTVGDKTITPYWQSACGRAVVYVGDCRDVMATMEPEQFHAVVTDPPYGLEFMGMEFDAPWKEQRKINALDQHIKHVAKVLATTFFDVVLPDYNKLVSPLLNLSGLSIPTLRSAALAFVDRTIWEESRVAVPERAVDLNHRVVLWNEEVKDADILSSVVSNRELTDKLNAYSFEEGFHFFLNLRPCGNVSFGDGLGCFVSDCGDGILRVPIVIPLDSCLSGFLSSLSPSGTCFVGDVIRFLNNPLGCTSRPALVMTSSGAELRAVLSLNTRDGSAELLPTDSTPKGDFIFELRCTKFIGAPPRASSLSPVFQPRSFSFVGDTTHRAFSICFHKSILSRINKPIEFMGKDWDAPWKKDGKIEVCDEGTDKSHPFRDGTQRVCYGNTKQHKSGAIIEDPASVGGFQDGNGGNPYSRSRVRIGGTNSRQRRAGEMDDESKRRYIASSVEYVRDSHFYEEWFTLRAAEIMRVCKPGAHLLSFGGTRMWHRMACAIEDAGFDVRDTLAWVYGSGFPKGTNISKSIDKMLGVEREVTGPGRSALSQGQFNQENMGDGGYGYKADYSETAATSEVAKQWEGWNSSLKPSYEPIIMARRPPVGSVAQNVMDHGCGGLNIGACRIGAEERWNESASNKDLENRSTVTPVSKHSETDDRPAVGRWPANLILSHHPECVLVGKRESKDSAVQTVSTGEVVSDNQAMSGPNYGRTIVGSAGRPDEEVWECHADCPCRMLDEQSGKTVSRIGDRGMTRMFGEATRGNNEGWTAKTIGKGYSDEGGASRFFYTAKADKADRLHMTDSTNHPTVKPLDLMRWLVRLVCAKGGTVLDPFMGSGSTGVAAIEEGMYFVGIEQSEEYAKIAVDRLKVALGEHPHLVKQLNSEKVVVKDTPPPPKTVRD